MDAVQPTPDSAHSQTINRWGRFWICTVVICFLSLGARLVYVQTALRPRLLSYLNAQQTRTHQLPARRGTILDTRGRLLAGSGTRPSIFADPHMISDMDGTVSQLAAVLGISETKLAETIRKRQHTRFVWLARRVSNVEQEAIASLDLPGIGIQSEPHRFYPNGPSLAHLLGFVGSDDKGLEGLELQFNEILAGRSGRYRTSCDAMRRPVWTKEADSVAPLAGQHVILTIDLVIQQFLETALRDAVTKFQAENAVGIVISPKNGDLLAMACHPSFDPNYPQEYPTEHRRNRCITDPVEPGSCFKPFILAAALAEGAATLDETVDCGKGVWFFGKRRMRDTHPRGLLTFEEVLVKSSNIGMGHVGVRLGDRRLHEYLGAYGFGAKTGIELPGESQGIVLPLRLWSSYSKTSIPIGQELAVTPIQLITAFAALANGGELRRPNLVRAVLQPTGQEVADFRSPTSARRILPKHTADLVAKRAMARVVNDSHHDIKLADYQVIGKTGTAQVPYSDRRGYEPNAYLGSFLGAAPADDPLVAVLVMVTKPNKSLGYYGGKVAGPAVREVIEKTLAYWDVPIDRGHTTQMAASTEKRWN